MAETGQLENSSNSESNSQSQSQDQQANHQQSTHSLPAPVENCESSMPQQLEETGSGGEGSHDQLVTPPTTPPSQLEDACTGSSEPSSPPPEDSLSSGGEQSSLPEDSPPFMTPGGQLEYSSLFWVVPEAVVSGEGQLLLSSASSTWSNSVDSPDPLENEPLSDEGMMPLNPGLMLDPQFLPPQMLMHPIVVQSKGLPSNGAQPGGDPPSPLPQGEDLKRLLLQQVEYYFSKENLGSDKYLLSQMDGDHFVPISIIANFSKVKQLTADVNLIIEAIRDSSQLQLDEEDEKVRAVPEKRCVLILREIPKETPKKEITGLFSHESCPRYVTCEFAENDCWYVTFDSEEDTQKAFSYLREVVREFLGHPIRARIKGTVVQHSAVPKKSRFSFPMQTVYNGTAPLQYYQQPGMVQAWPTYYDPNYTPYMNGYPPHQGAYNGPPNRFNNMHNSHHHSGPGGRGSGPGGRGRPPRAHSPGPSSSIDGVGGGSSGSGRSSRGDYSSSGGRYRRDRDDERPSRNIPRLRNRQRGGAGEGERNPPPRQQHRQQQKLDLAPANFPPLPTAETGVTSPNPTPPPTANHSEEGVSNLADIVKGKRLKDGYLSNGFGGGHQSEKPGLAASSPTSSSQPAVQQSSQSNAQPHPQPHPPTQPQPPKPEVKVPSKDNKPLHSGSSRSTDRDTAPYRQNGSRTTQVTRLEGRPALPPKSRHRERERRPGSGSRPPQPPRPSPKTPRKQVPPPPPSAPNADKSPVKQESGPKCEKLSYAQMAQKPKSQSTPVKSVPSTTQPGNSSSNNSSSSQPASGQTTPQALPQSPVKLDLTNGEDGGSSITTPSSPSPSSPQQLPTPTTPTTSTSST